MNELPKLPEPPALPEPPSLPPSPTLVAEVNAAMREHRSETASDYLKLAFTAVSFVSGPAAMAMSYSKHQSIPWALLHGAVGLPYLFYVAIKR